MARERRIANRLRVLRAAIPGLVALALMSQPTQADQGPQRQAGPAIASIIKGTTASITELPWLAHIHYHGPVENYECTGTVVAPRLILTAAHCGLSEAGRIELPENFSVVTGVADVRQTSATISTVTQVLIAPGFNLGTLAHDSALLVLSAPISAPAIPLATASDASLYAAGTSLTIAGWGLTSGNSTRAPTRLRRGQTVIQDASYCRRNIQHIDSGYSSEAQLCAVSAPKFEVTACHGDSGGPGIAYRANGAPVQVGVISFGLGDCNPRQPEVQTRVDAISEWARSWINAVEQGAAPPEVFVPQPERLPRLSIPVAKILSFEGLAADFGQRFLRGKFTEIGCRRIDREKVKCLIFWYYAPQISVYMGAITVYLSLPREGSLWQYRYRIRRVNAICWLNSRRPKACPGVLFYR